MNNEKGKLYFGLGLDNDQLRADALESRNIIKGIGDSTAAEGARIDNAYRKIAGTVAAVFTVQQAAAFAKSIVQVRGEIESLEISFETLLGNKQKANALFSEIKTYAVNTPMQMNDLAKGAQMLLSFNVEAERVMPILKQIGDISMGDAQKFNSLTLAFSQMSSTGKLMGQDLLQMINAGFNPLSVISEKTGKSIGVLKKEMEGGLITSKMVSDAFASATSEGGKFYGMLDKQSKGINGSMSNLTGAITDMFNDLGTENQEFITDTIQGATTAVKHYKEIGEAIAVIVATYGTYKAVIMATEAVRQSIETVKRTEEAAELMKLLSIEQQAKISKLGLAKTSLEYAAAVKAEVAANVQAAQSALIKARADVVAANQSVVARREEYIAAKQLESQRLAELMSIGATGTAKQVEAVQRKLSAAEMQRESSALAFQSATRDFNAKKTVVETAARTANTTATAANTAVQTANITVTSFLSVAKTRLAAVAAKLNAVIMANPYALAAAAVIALGYGIYKLVTHQTDAEKAQTKLNDAIKEADKSIASERYQIELMFSRLKAAKKGTEEYEAAKRAIINQYGNYLKKLGDEKTALDNIADAYRVITEEATKAAHARAMQSITDEAGKTFGDKQSETYDDVDKFLKKKLKGKKGSDGKVDASDEYMIKLKPVIMDGAEITPDVEKILKIFDEKVDARYDAESGIKVMDEYISNALKTKLSELQSVKVATEKTVHKALAKYGEVPKDNNEKNKFDATSASLQQLMEQLPKAKDELDALKKAEQPDPAAIAAKEQEVQQIKDQTAAREKSVTAIKDVKAQIELLQKEQEKYGKDDTEYTALETRIKSLKTKLPQTEGQANKSETDAARIKRETAERNEKIKEYEDAVKKQVKQSELDIAQARIDAMEDGYAKEQAQNDIAYQRLILANQQREAGMVKALQDARELEWENKNPKAKAKGETFDRSTVTAVDLSPNQKSQITEFYAVAEGIREKANGDSLEKMLDDFMTYEQQRNKITEDYAKKRKSMHNEDGSFKAGFTQGNEDELNRNESEATKAIDEQFAQRELTYTAWCDQIANDAIESLKKTLAQAKKELEKAEKSSATGSKLAVARAKVTKAQEKVDKADADKKTSPGKRTLKEWKDLYETLQDVQGEFDKIGDAVGGVAGEIIDTAGQIATSTLSMINGIVQLANWATISTKMTAEGVAASIQTVEKASVILTIISAAMQIAMTIINLFNNDKDYQKEIEKLQGRIEQLQWELDNADAIRLQSKSFNVLQKIKELYAETTREVLKLHAANNQYGNAMIMLFGRAIYQNEIMQKSAEKLATAYANISYTADKALGSEKFSGAKDQLKNIAEQQLLMQEQIRNEDAKKKTDHGQIEEWERQIQELGAEANKIINEIVEDIIGGSAADLAAELGDAFIEAFQNGEDAAEAWGDKVNEIVANVMKRMLVSKFLEEPLGEIFDKYKAKWFKDGEFELNGGIQGIMDSMGDFANDLNGAGATFQGIWENLPDDVKNMFAPTDEAREASQKGIASASQESVDELNGRITAVQGHTYLLAENSKMLVANSNKILNHLAGIEDNTKSLARLEQIETDMGAVKNTLSDIALKGIKVK